MLTKLGFICYDQAVVEIEVVYMYNGFRPQRPRVTVTRNGEKKHDQNIDELRESKTELWLLAQYVGNLVEGCMDTNVDITTYLVHLQSLIA